MSKQRLRARCRSRASLALAAVACTSVMVLCAGASPGAAPGALRDAEPIMVTTDGGSHPTVSPDGQWVAFVTAAGAIAKIPAAGGDPEVLVSAGREPDWSRTGDLIVYRVDAGLFTVDAATKTVALVLDGGSWDDDPCWSPLGDEIAAQSSGNSIAIIAYPDGQLSTIPCLDPDNSSCQGEGPTWSPDGLWLAFEDGTDLLKIPRAGGTAVNLYNYVDSRDVTQPTWSPDGRWIAFRRSAGGETGNIWVIDASGYAQGMHQVTSGVYSDSSPAWSPDGGTIYFSSNRSGSGQIWKVAAPAVPAGRRSWGDLKGRYR